LNTYQNPFF
jgi:glutamate/tyrosine decarboxylase-like PLP-dependent enzyme